MAGRESNMRASRVPLAGGLAVSCIAVAVAMTATAPQAQQTLSREIAVLQGLDKITARISTLEAPIEETVTFGSLEIVARTCQETPPEEAPESAAFLEITDNRPDGPREEVFKGWMFASSPAVSAMEHAVYDIWVIDCINVADLQDTDGEDAQSAEESDGAAQ